MLWRHLGDGILLSKFATSKLILLKKVETSKLIQRFLEPCILLTWYELHHWLQSGTMHVFLDTKTSFKDFKWYWSGFGAHLGPDLIRFRIEKWSVFGPILVNPGPIWQMAALPDPWWPVLSKFWIFSHCDSCGVWVGIDAHEFAS